MAIINKCVALTGFFSFGDQNVASALKMNFLRKFKNGAKNFMFGSPTEEEKNLKIFEKSVTEGRVKKSLLNKITWNIYDADIKANKEWRTMAVDANTVTGSLPIPGEELIEVKLEYDWDKYLDSGRVNIMFAPSDRRGERFSIRAKKLTPFIAAHYWENLQKKNPEKLDSDQKLYVEHCDKKWAWTLVGTGGVAEMVKRLHE